MSRIQKVELEKATEVQKSILETIKKKMGKLPNIYASIAQSPAALQMYLSFDEHLQKGLLDGKTREIITLTVSQYNGCNYCLSAHSFIGSRKFGMTEEELLRVRQGQSNDKQIQSLLNFVYAVVDKRAKISDEDYLNIRNAGYSEAEIVEIVAVIVQTIFTNYFNLIAQTEIDFPMVSAAELKKVA
ncbi:MAG: carboxymuconolactone decarboxylase family protein [Ignavibacteriae bacterium]|nr:carboxymuconolactone decarboxylase family protein [Ignavibacteriota bacterium]